MTNGDLTLCNPEGPYTDCVGLQWPRDVSSADRQRDLARGSWHGSLSGFGYARNRYYDPATWRFTQEDPIGLAGGLNTYGYAAGDPINYRDPFGLDTLKVEGDQQFKQTVDEACAGGAKATCDKLKASTKVYWVVQGSQFCGNGNSATQPVTENPGCESINGISYEGTGGSRRSRVPPDLAAWLGGDITGGVSLINDQQVGGVIGADYSGWSDVVWHEVTHLLGVENTGHLYVHPRINQGVCPPAFKGVPGCR